MLSQRRIADRLHALPHGRLQGMLRGIEKESLRTRPDGSLALTPHPPALGSALTHPHITTDFSESQLELITGVHGSVESCLEELGQIHQHVYRSIGDELLWAGSMPCDLPPDASIPIANYGNSNFRRHSFLLLYLFGASPALGSSFMTGRAHGLTPVGPDTLGMPQATSLRMGRLGYQSDAQSALAVTS